MSEIVADLHLHSTFSDGLHTPAALAELVAGKGLRAFSLTDHDTVAGHALVPQNPKVTFIPGIELTATHDGKEVHLLGYYINKDEPELGDILAKIAARRTKRLMDIVDKLNNAGKVLLDKDELAEDLGTGSYNRLNLARFMVKKGLAQSIERVFNSYLGDSSDAYEAVNYLSPVHAIKLIHQCGGVAFLAHPYTNNTSLLIPELVECGLNGIEAFHPSHGVSDVKKCLDWAVRFKLGVSGGSDFHGNENSPRKILSAGLNGERLVDFLALNPSRDCVIA
ncbi:MAG: PHP domain-containing protein [Nitrospinae bacterium]|nr:PHP domain-containing protein [Nitrospinota bacterium]